MRIALQRHVTAIALLLFAVTLSAASSHAASKTGRSLASISKVMQQIRVEPSSIRRATLARALSDLVETVHPINFGVVLIDDIAALLEDGEGSVRSAAAMSLGHIGPAARRALPALEKALARELANSGTLPAPSTATNMFVALASIRDAAAASPASPPSSEPERTLAMISKVMQQLQTERSSIGRAALAQALIDLVKKLHSVEFDEASIDGIAALLEDGEEPVRSAAATSLAHIGPPARRALPALEKALTKEMRGQVIVPPASTAASMVAALVSIHGRMGIVE